MSWIRRLLGLCEHYFEYIATNKISEEGRRRSNETGEWKDFNFTKHEILFMCRKCGKRIIQ